MAISRSVDHEPVSVAEAQLARIAGDGCARHSYLKSLTDASRPHVGRDLADATHLLCSLHGRYPGLIEIALQQSQPGEARSLPVRPGCASHLKFSLMAGNMVVGIRGEHRNRDLRDTYPGALGRRDGSAVMEPGRPASADQEA